MGNEDGASGAVPVERAPYPGRLSPDELAEIKALYLGGATAKALALRFGGSERRIYGHLRDAGCLRKDQPEGTCDLDAEAVAEVVRETRGCQADAPCRALSPEASLGEAARAAATTAIAMLRDAQPGRSYTYARLAGTLERLARGGAASDRDDPEGQERGRQAALDFLRREGVRTVPVAPSSARDASLPSSARDASLLHPSTTSWSPSP